MRRMARSQGLPGPIWTPSSGLAFCLEKATAFPIRNRRKPCYRSSDSLIRAPICRVESSAIAARSMEACL